MNKTWKTRITAGLVASLLTVGFAAPAYAAGDAATPTKVATQTAALAPMASGLAKGASPQEFVAKIYNSFTECTNLAPIIAAMYGTPFWTCVPQPNTTTYLILIKWW